MAVLRLHHTLPPTGCSGQILRGATIPPSVRFIVARYAIAVNVTQSGMMGNGASFDFSLSSDGRRIAFLTRATDLGPSDANGKDDVFVRDVTTGELKLISLNAAGTSTPNDASVRPRISADGSVVVFESRASDLVPNDSNGQTDVFASIPSPLPRRRAARL